MYDPNEGCPRPSTAWRRWNGRLLSFGLILTSALFLVPAQGKGAPSLIRIHQRFTMSHGRRYDLTETEWRLFYAGICLGLLGVTMVITAAVRDGIRSRTDKELKGGNLMYAFFMPSFHVGVYTFVAALIYFVIKVANHA